MSPQLRGLHFSPHLHMNPQNVHAENNDMMTAVGRMGVSTRYDSKNGSYVRTNNEYKNLVQNRPSNNLDSFEIEANSLLPSRRN